MIVDMIHYAIIYNIVQERPSQAEGRGPHVLLV